MRIISAAFVALAVGVGFSVPRGFSQTPAASYAQTASLDEGQLTYNQSVTGPFSLTGQDSIAQTDIETTPTLVDTVVTLNGTTMSEVVTTGAASSPNSASTDAQYYTEVDSSIARHSSP